VDDDSISQTSPECKGGESKNAALGAALRENEKL
jgi:hypothetical protein